MELLLQKYDSLKEYLRNLDSVAIAFSSGVDSTFLLFAAKDAFGVHTDDILAVTATSVFFPHKEATEAVEYCKKLGVKQAICNVSVNDIEGFVNNPPDRCYICKRAIFAKFIQFARENRIKHVIEGTNADDVGDYRPGMRAIKELNILSPLKELGFTKDDIRKLSKHFDIPTWNKPSFACLASRFPYGEMITEEKLHMVEEGENTLHLLGFSQYRVRIHGNDTFEASIELLPSEMHLLDDDVKEQIQKKLFALGFTKIVFDPRGYRTGSMNESLSEDMISGNTNI